MNIIQWTKSTITNESYSLILSLINVNSIILLTIVNHSPIPVPSLGFPKKGRHTPFVFLNV